MGLLGRGGGSLGMEGVEARETEGQWNREGQREGDSVATKRRNCLLHETFLKNTFLSPLLSMQTKSSAPRSDEHKLRAQHTNKQGLHRV